MKDLVHKSVNETVVRSLLILVIYITTTFIHWSQCYREAEYVQELKQYPALRVEVTNAAIESLDKMREGSKKATLQLVDMECSYLTVDFFRKLPQDAEKGGNPTHSIFDRYNDSYLRRIGIVKSLYSDAVSIYIYIFFFLPHTTFYMCQQDPMFCLT